MVKRWACGVASVAAACWLGFGQIRTTAPTYDEGAALTSGYLSLTTRLKPIRWEGHPPFAELWAAVPLLILKPAALFEHGRWGEIYNFSDAFLYENTVDAERMLNTARTWTLWTWTAALALVVLSWAYRLDGAVGLAAAAICYAFCVPLFSNAALVSTDMGATVFYAAAFWLLAAKPRRWGLAGTCVGLALASKFSTIILPPLALAAVLGERRWAKTREPFPWAGLATAAVAALLVLALCYRGHLRVYWEGLTTTLTTLDQGRASFFAGRRSVTGTWMYFPAALCLKTPLPLLLFAAAGLWRWCRKPSPERAWIVVPAAAFFLAACASKTQIGYRHILPVYPFLVVLAASAARRAWDASPAGRRLCLAAAAWLAFGVLRVHPHHLAYFNELAGGPSGGHRWLLDSNLDWGQGLKALAAELQKRGNPHVFLCYFGVGDPSYYGIRYTPVAWVSHVEARRGALPPRPVAPSWLAISATNLHAVYYADPSLFSWLRDRRPLFAAGHSIFVYDLSGDADGLRRIARMLGALRSGPE